MSAAGPLEAGDQVTLHGQQHLLATPCDRVGGHWACVTCEDQTFPNNLQATIHEDENSGHALVWVCPDHGPEAAP